VDIPAEELAINHPQADGLKTAAAAVVLTMQEQTKQIQLALTAAMAR